MSPYQQYCRWSPNSGDWQGLHQFTESYRQPCAWKERSSLNTANRLSAFLKVADIPPRTSIASGTNVIPNFAQLSSWRQYFLSSSASSAYLAFVAALVRELDCKDEVTVTSNSAGFPAFQVGTKMSRGVIGFLELNSFFPLLVRDSQMSKHTLFYLESGHVLQLRLLDRDTQWYDPHRCHELLFCRTGTSFRHRRQGHPGCKLR